jgi:hypothetical protein
MCSAPLACCGGAVNKRQRRHQTLHLHSELLKARQTLAK